MSVESEEMMLLLAELAAKKKAQENGEKSPITGKRRREIGKEMKRLAAERKNAVKRD